MKNHWRSVSIILLLVIGLALLASCTDETSSTSAAPPTSTPSASTTQTATTGPSQSSGRTTASQTTANGASPSEFFYDIRLEEISIPEFKGLHSFAYAQHDGKWLLVGGRTDGLHARQPMAAFPNAYNNQDLIVMDPVTKEYWSAPLDPLPVDIREHLQSTNMNFHQSGDTLFIIGGYAYSESARGHITFPKLTTLQVSDVIQDVMSGRLDSRSFRHAKDERFAVTGGQLGKMGNAFYLVGGHRFDGRYTPHATPQNNQVYTNAIQRFQIDMTGASPVILNYSSLVDKDQLRRRDYNLVPYLFADGRPGYLISTGVFQPQADIPFLSVVEIDQDAYYPVDGFEQYLSHYHSPKLAMYEPSQRTLHMLFFGGLAQFHYEGGVLVKDDQVPFVTTISRVTRSADGTFSEHVLPVSMPDFAGTSAEFIPNTTLSRNETGVFLMDPLATEPALIGHMVGGITSPVANPFSVNQTNLTKADSRIFRIWIIYRGAGATLSK